MCRQNFKFEMAASQSQKSRDFVSGTLRGPNGKFNPITSVPGIGEVSASALAKTGFKTVGPLMGQFLLLECDEELMAAWLRDKLPSSVQGSFIDQAVSGLSQWARMHL